MILVVVDAYDRPGLLRDLTSLLASLGSNILFSHSIVEDGIAKMVLLADSVSSSAEALITNIPSVKSVKIVEDVGYAATIVAELGVKYPEIVASLFKIVPAGFAARVLEIMEPQHRIPIIRLLSIDRAVEILSETNSEVVADIIERLWPDSRDMVIMLPSDRLDDIIRFLEPRIARALMDSLPGEKRRIVESLLTYPADSVASVMRVRIPKVLHGESVKRALDLARQYSSNTIFVVDEKGLLMGEVSVEDIIYANPSDAITKFVKRPRVILRADMDREKAARNMIIVRSRVAPVVDNKGVLVGAVYMEDLLDTLISELSEDVFRLEAIYAKGGISYVSTSPIRWAALRTAGLIVITIVQLVTSGIILNYEEVILSAAITAAFIPLILDAAGNIGTQISTIIVRELTIGTLTPSPKSAASIALREALTSSIIGASLAGIGSLVAYVVTGQPTIASTVFVSLFLVVIVLDIVSALLPMVFASLRIDPAIASGPLITTLGDVIGLLIYFNIVAATLATPG